MAAHGSNLSRLFAQLHAETWLIEPSGHAALVAAVEHASNESAGIVDDLLKQRDRAEAMSVADGVAEIPVNGPLLRAPGVLERILLGATDTGAIGQKVAQASMSPDVRSILLTIDSPGGSIAGIPELAAQIRAVAKKKPIVAFTDGMMASAAYWLGSQASTIIASTSASVGSIGVFIPWRDSSKMAEAMGLKVGVVKNKGGTYKGMGYPGTSYTEEQMAHLQARADEIFGMFRADVTSGRKRVRADAMQGQTFLGESALAAGLVDAVDSHLNAWNKAYQMTSTRPVTSAATVATSSPANGARAEFARLNAAGDNRAASKFYAAHRALILAR